MSKRVLVACEYSGIVRDAFIQEGFDAVSCDLDRGKGEGPRLQRDALEVMSEKVQIKVIAMEVRGEMTLGHRNTPIKYAGNVREKIEEMDLDADNYEDGEVVTEIELDTTEEKFEEAMENFKKKMEVIK